jgi:hypothetical protein
MKKNHSDDQGPFGEDPDEDAEAFLDEMTDELARFVGDRWRAAHDAKPISVALSLSSAINRLPAQWLEAACVAHNIAPRGAVRANRRAKALALHARLSDTDMLARAVLDMPPYARAALRRVIDRGGSMRLSALVRDFGDMTGDGWFWDEQPPRSSIGELRRRALVFVGRVARAPAKASAGKRRGHKIVVVPLELRKPLGAILADAAVRREEEQALESYYASSDDLLREALDAARGFYATAAIEPVFERGDLDGFLRDASASGFNPMLIWGCLETMLAFFECQAHELRAPTDLAGYHISEMATDFVDQQYLQRWSLDERRDLIETVRRLYAYLLVRNVVNADTHEEVEASCKTLIASKRKVREIMRPPALGGELLILRVDPRSGREQRFTINHQRVVMTWYATKGQNWAGLRARCAQVPSGEAKAALIDELETTDMSVCELLLARAESSDLDAAVRWFYDDVLLNVSAW